MDEGNVGTIFQIMKFGDKIREQLKNPDSGLSILTRKFNCWKRLAKNQSDRYTLVYTTWYGDTGFHFIDHEEDSIELSNGNTEGLHIIRRG